ncbi:MAG TPA: ABC transporter permease [Anaerolineales bacterium]|nr:ABC transporter permease [Anaerolineales bacterium]HNB41876.1 ABC transporter permease [Anaerolineales bacterium]HND47180.1 ABC transporter permease [Anaerolineales bacterium]HNH25758.1 ABC transporter permease [Anaerolineales bacterium]HNO92977.1 ABC transporter permease [Anaerolineales bacterium]
MSTVQASNQSGTMIAEIEAPSLSLRDLTWRRFRRHKMAIVGLGVLILLIIYSFGGAFFVTEKYSNFTNTKERLQPPSAEHPFGTDTVGRDLMARTIYGGQISIIIGITAAFVEVMMGILIGAIAGYFGGKIDAFLMRFTEAMLNLPQLLLLIVMAKFFSSDIKNINLFGREFSGSVVVIIFIIGLTSWPYLARIVRAEFLSIKEREFILAARATGTPTWEIIFKHILPNSIAPIVVSATLGVAGAISLEAYVSFLGLGVRAPTATWGNMLENAYRYIESAYWMWLFPGLFIVLIVLSINFLGDGLRDALDPRSRTV